MTQRWEQKVKDHAVKAIHNREAKQRKLIKAQQSRALTQAYFGEFVDHHYYHYYHYNHNYDLIKLAHVPCICMYVCMNIVGDVVVHVYTRYG